MFIIKYVRLVIFYYNYNYNMRKYKIYPHNYNYNKTMRNDKEDRKIIKRILSSYFIMMIIFALI